MADANLKGVEDPLEPMVFMFDPSDPGLMYDLSVRIRAGRIPETLAFIDGTWRKFQPGAVIQRRFLVDTFDDFFRAADREGEMLGVFVGIAIVIACLGLFGLAAFTAERRTKEIGVRKVAGARTGEIVRLMLWRISIPVLLANLIAWPVAYFYLHRWLEDMPIAFLSARCISSPRARQPWRSPAPRYTGTRCAWRERIPFTPCATSSAAGVYCC